MIPEGYRESLETSENRIQDPLLRKYYDQLHAITRSRDLLSAARLQSILRMNLGAYDHLIDRDFYRYAGARVSLGAMAVFRQDGTPWNFEGNRVLKTSLAVLCDDRPGRKTSRLLQPSLSEARLQVALDTTQQTGPDVFTRMNRYGRHTLAAFGA